MVITAQELTKTYSGGTTALAAVTVNISEGEMVGILGSSGAGKTTLLRLISGVLRPTSGSLTVLGQSLANQSPASLQRLRRRLGVILQNHTVIPSLSVSHNVLMGSLGFHSLAQFMSTLFYVNELEANKVFLLLRQLGIADKMHDRADDLSGGQQQRVAVARAIFADPELILADEPVASVDPQTAEVILNLLQRLNLEQGKTILINLHQVDIAVRFCSRVLVLAQGQLIYDGVPGLLDQTNIYRMSLADV